MTITTSADNFFEAESNGWRIYAKWDGCAEFSRNNGEDHVHVCSIEQFVAAVTEARDEMKRRQYELDY